MESGNHDDITVMFVTANVGTLFEMADVMMNLWIKEFIQAVALRRPQLIALHCQELGGKKATRTTMEQTSQFARQLLERAELAEYDRVRIFLDENFRSMDTFTALGSAYFAHQSLRTVQLWDYAVGDYVDVVGRDMILFAPDEPAPPQHTSIHKVRFPIDHHPLAKGSRKGFTRTRWRINGTPMDLVNIHLFYDEDNLVAMETSPSQYTDARAWGLRHCIDSFQADGPAGVPFFIFGDFNFRLDVHDVVKKLTENGIRQDVLVNGVDPADTTPPRARVCFVENDDLNKLILTIEKKTFDHHDKHDYVFQVDNGKWLRNFDHELTDFGPELTEMEINFPPSYPYEEDMDRGKFYMKTRCPAWCDRIVMNAAGRHLLATHHAAVVRPEYDLIGASVCMGDHKVLALGIFLLTLTNFRKYF
ncbi:inositol polyphosphate-5-phosphatase A-like [Paramacrobiotus metropolitanus]|uniref:inositol polyphosphate-5-phosphatase A-like n=1 Tax=Paramacrobiotus metropolitanus TaxID=2943436 RepID=UPI002445D5D2|nr:inositol polyphosphate-5-phosphatase A-like [Paramacrobiotus metropolitanus]